MKICPEKMSMHDVNLFLAEGVQEAPGEEGIEEWHLLREDVHPFSSGAKARRQGAVMEGVHH